MGFLKRVSSKLNSKNTTTPYLLANRMCCDGGPLTDDQYKAIAMHVKQGDNANNYCPKCGATLLACAVRNKRNDMIALLINNGADVFKDDDFQKGITTLDSLVELGHKRVEGKFIYTSSTKQGCQVWAIFWLGHRELAIYYDSDSVQCSYKDADVYIPWREASFKHEGLFLWIEAGARTCMLEPAYPQCRRSVELFNWFCKKLKEATGDGSSAQQVGDGFDPADTERAIEEGSSAQQVGDGFDPADIERAIMASYEPFCNKLEEATGEGSAAQQVGFDPADIRRAIMASYEPSAPPLLPAFPECNVCLNSNLDVAVMACGHVACAACLVMIHQFDKLCPLC